MNKLQSYVIKEVLKAFVPAFLVLALIMVLGFCVQLLHEGLDVVRLRGLPLHLVSYSVPVVLPSAFLTAVIVAFGRLSADNEITAMRVAGVHLLRIILPVCVLALLLSGVAGYFQFQAVPRARRSIKLLKYDAVKQILMEKVALNAQRQFSFYPCHVQYDDFRNDEMVEVFIVEAPHGAPRTIITAASGTITPDPNSQEFVLLKLRDCAVTWLDVEGLGAPRAMATREIVMSVKVAPPLKKISTDVKYLPLPDLLRRLGELRKAAGQHTEIFRDPDRKGDELRDRINEINIQSADLTQIRERHAKKLDKLRQDDLRELHRLVELKEKEIKSAKEHLDILTVQKASYLSKIEQLRQEMKEGSAGFDSIVQLQNRLREANSGTETMNDKIAEAKSAIKKARTQIQETHGEVGEIGEELALLDKDIRELKRRREDLRKQHALVQQQEDLREVEIRIHKRLAQAAAVFVFATIGIPLGIMSRRRSIMVAFGISFSIVLVLFYPFLILGQIVSELGLFPVTPAMWSGNALTLLIGLLLTAVVLSK